MQRGEKGIFMEYRIHWRDVTEEPEELAWLFNYQVINQDHDEIEFEVADPICCQPEELRKEVEQYLFDTFRVIKVFSVTDERGQVVLTEADFEKEAHAN